MCDTCRGETTNIPYTPEQPVQHQHLYCAAASVYVLVHVLLELQRLRLNTTFYLLKGCVPKTDTGSVSVQRYCITSLSFNFYDTNTHTFPGKPYIFVYDFGWYFVKVWKNICFQTFKLLLWRNWTKKVLISLRYWYNFKSIGISIISNKRADSVKVQKCHTKVNIELAPEFDVENTPVEVWIN